MLVGIASAATLDLCLLQAHGRSRSKLTHERLSDSLHSWHCLEGGLVQRLISMAKATVATVLALLAFAGVQTAVLGKIDHLIAPDTHTPCILGSSQRFCLHIMRMWFVHVSRPCWAWVACACS